MVILWRFFMTNKIQHNKKTRKGSKNEITNMVHECAKSLHNAGFIDQTKMDKYDVMCLKSKTKYTPKQVKDLRKRYNMSQAALAIIMNTSFSTISKWEIGNKHPSGTSLRLLNILDKKGLEVFKNLSP